MSDLLLGLMTGFYLGLHFAVAMDKAISENLYEPAWKQWAVLLRLFMWRVVWFAPLIALVVYRLCKQVS